MIHSLHFIEASTSGNTEYVVGEIASHIKRLAPGCTVECQRAEIAGPDDLLRGDLVILGSGTWNTGGTEGQLNTHMHALLSARAKNIDLGGRPMTFISLGDERYYFRTRCVEHFLRFQREHGATLFVPPLIIVNEPYGQEDRILAWTEKLLGRIAKSDAAVGSTSRKAASSSIA